jgi:hypothetical protein
MPRRALVAYSSSSTHVQTTLDYLVGFKKHSGFETSFVHVTHDAKLDFDISSFDLIFHNYCSRFCFEGYVSADYQAKLRAFQGLKILAIQDEYDHTNILKAAIKDMGFHIVLTCVPQDSLEYVYPKSEFPNVTFLTVFTGYVTDDFEAEQIQAPALSERPIVVGYRGRNIGGRYGRLGFDKFEIGRRMKEICDAKGIVNDIAMDEASRIYGTAWFDYLGRCRSMLGSESGSNVFDFDSSIDALYKKMMADNGGEPPSYEAMLPLVAERDGAIQMGQISPRVFECAIMRTPMVLFKGRYSDAIKPDEHYISLEKDFSNVDDVLRRLEDIPALEAMTERAYDHLVGSRRFNYATFFSMIGKVATQTIKQTQAIKQTQTLKQTKEASRKAVEASGSGLVVRDWFGYERPSHFPEKPDMFKMRLSFAEIRLLKGEDDRLTSGFVDHRALLLTNLEQHAGSLRSVSSDAFNNMATREGSAGSVAPDADLFPEITAFLAHSDTVDRDWTAKWTMLAGAVDQAVAKGESAAMPVAVDAALIAVRERYGVIGEKYTAFGKLYEQGMKRAAEETMQAQKALVQTLSAEALRDPRKIGPVLRESTRIATYIASLWGKDAVRDSGVKYANIVRHPALQGFKSWIYSKAPWAMALYRRFATYLRQRIGP